MAELLEWMVARGCVHVGVALCLSIPCQGYLCLSKWLGPTGDEYLILLGAWRKPGWEVNPNVLDE